MFNHNPEERIKRLEEEVMWLRRDLINLMVIVESIAPEVHYHITYHFHTKPCMDKQIDLNDFI